MCLLNTYRERTSCSASLYYWIEVCVVCIWGERKGKCYLVYKIRFLSGIRAVVSVITEGSELTDQDVPTSQGLLKMTWCCYAFNAKDGIYSSYQLMFNLVRGAFRDPLENMSGVLSYISAFRSACPCLWVQEIIKSRIQFLTVSSH